MATLSSSSTISSKKLKLDEDSAVPDMDMVISTTEPEVMDDDLMDIPDDEENEENDDDENVVDDDDDASSTYEYDEYEFSAYDETLSLQAQFDAADLPPGVEASVPWLEESDEFKKVGATVPNESSCGLTDIEDQRIKEQMRLETILKNYMEFKTFDTVQDYSDHYYMKQASSAKEPPREWAKTIQNEWKLLESGLPETIFVRVYEENMELLRAVMIGATGTPYHDGLFFFDCFFPSTYPSIPPLVYYHSGGLRLNPNLYNCGKVCLSLLGTWPGRSASENWIPGKSNMLQVLLSIQALVLNEKPYFNEPGYEKTAGQEHGQKRAKDYNENTFIYSIKTMGYSLHKPPMYFEDFVYGHFRVRAHSILEACTEYLKGAEVGSHVETEEEEGQEKEAEDILSDKKTFLKKFREDLSVVVGNLIPVLIKNGASDCEKYIPLGDIKRKAPLKI